MFFGGAACAASTSVVEVRTDAGPIRGVVANGIISFKGIPYAAPPVGENRWKQLQPTAKWTEVRDAVNFGADCMQIPFPADAAPLRTKPAENCLYVNVWRPEKPKSASLPVMVWIYGGGFVNGGTSPEVYDGSAFARDGIVFVSFNYRLARFGFFAHPALTAEQRGKPLANYAFMDQIAALQWVQRNIASFGGDAKNVTIFGESAGGVSVTTLMTTPLARGLFHKAIVESGGGRPGLFAMKHVAGEPDAAEASGIAFAKLLGIDALGPESLAILRTAPAESVAAGINLDHMAPDPTYVGGPVNDGKVVLGVASTLFSEGRGANVPLMIGVNDADIGFPRGGTIDELVAPFGADAEKARAAYNPDGKADAKTVAAKIGSDAMMAEPARHIARLLSSRGQPVYHYRFSYVAESLRGKWPGALHASEIPYVFDTVAAKYGRELTPQDATAAKAMHDAWVAFVKTGAPSVAGQPSWPRYTASNDAIMDFTNSGPKAGPDPWKDRLDLAERMANGREDSGRTRR
jgi:para-nitrobenzyl esterase